MSKEDVYQSLLTMHAGESPKVQAELPAEPLKAEIKTNKWLQGCEKKSEGYEKDNKYEIEQKWLKDQQEDFEVGAVQTDDGAFIDYGSVDSPYNRTYREPLTLELLLLCLEQMECTNMPLPLNVTERLIADVRMFQTHRMGEVLRHEKETPTALPDEAIIQKLAVVYVGLALKWKLHNSPIKQLVDELGIPRGTFNGWRDAYLSPELLEYYADSKALAESQMQWIWVRLEDRFNPPA